MAEQTLQLTSALVIAVVVAVTQLAKEKFEVEDSKAEYLTLAIGLLFGAANAVSQVYRDQGSVSVDWLLPIVLASVITWASAAGGYKFARASIDRLGGAIAKNGK